MCYFNTIKDEFYQNILTISKKKEDVDIENKCSELTTLSKRIYTVGFIFAKCFYCVVVNLYPLLYGVNVKF